MLPHITQHLSKESFETTNLLHMRTVKLVAPHFKDRKPIDLSQGRQIRGNSSWFFQRKGALFFRNSIFGMECFWQATPSRVL